MQAIYALLAQSLSELSPKNGLLNLIGREDHQTARIDQWERDCKTVASSLEHADSNFSRPDFLRSCGIGP